MRSNAGGAPAQTAGTLARARVPPVDVAARATRTTDTSIVATSVAIVDVERFRVSPFMIGVLRLRVIVVRSADRSTAFEQRLEPANPRELVVAMPSGISGGRA